MKRKNWFTWLLVLFSVLFLVVLPILALAQDTTPDVTDMVAVPPLEPTALPTVVVEPTPVQPPVVVVQQPDPTPTYWIFAATIFGLLATITLVLRPLIVHLAASAPQWAIDAGLSAADRLVQSGQDYADLTPSHVDDEIMEDLNALLLEIRGELETLRRERASPKASLS